MDEWLEKHRCCRCNQWKSESEWHHINCGLCCPVCYEVELNKQATRFALKHPRSSLQGLLNELDRISPTLERFSDDSLFDNQSNDRNIPLSIVDVYKESYGNQAIFYIPQWN